MTNLFTDPVALYSQLVSTIATKELRGGKTQALAEYCPFCGADNQKHIRASFGQVLYGNWGFHCFACGKSCSLFHLANLFNVLDRPIVERKPTEIRDPQLPSWYSGRKSLQGGYTSSQDKYTKWATYKGVTPEMVDRYQLGYGVLPGDKGRMHSCPHYRLITPILDGSGGVVWFRGRRMDCDCANWHSANMRDYSMQSLGVALPQSHYAKSNGEIFITENYIDAGLINMSSRYSAVATLSTSYWLPSWTEQLRQLNPVRIFMAFDHDTSGNGGTLEQVKDRAIQFVSRREKCADVVVTGINVELDSYAVDWQCGDKRGVQHIGSPRGVILANHLLQQGFNVRMVKWRHGVKDIGQWLTN